MNTIARLSLQQYDQMIEAGVFDDELGRRQEFIGRQIQEMNPIDPQHEEVLELLTEWSF
ncbi:MAG: hypothetical protein GXY83_38835 [Rhodopirellula sp.]|nr:hypothetical protein [Rhodopirellula sp.]